MISPQSLKKNYRTKKAKLIKLQKIKKDSGNQNRFQTNKSKYTKIKFVPSSTNQPKTAAKTDPKLTAKVSTPPQKQQAQVQILKNPNKNPPQSPQQEPANKQLLNATQFQTITQLNQTKTPSNTKVILIYS